MENNLYIVKQFNTIWKLCYTNCITHIWKKTLNGERECKFLFLSGFCPMNLPTGPLGPKSLAPLGETQRFTGNLKNVGIVEVLNRRQLMSDEPKVMEESGDTDLLAAIFGRHLAV